MKFTEKLFSGSVATALEFFGGRPECIKLKDCQATVSFTRRLNTLFDCLNIQRSQDVAQAGPGRLNVIKESITRLEEWCAFRSTLAPQQQVCFLSKKTCAALRVTLRSTVALVEPLRASGFKYVLTRKLNQDPLDVKACSIHFS
ncbi:uncharacterized protein LOC135389570 [Ornithodoros turicata]|uniref:uncharacterized protein LOC135389570 n=1 Tax=Ornithodoros turicata TaxID=34597 RepID=UPI0031392CD5